MRTWTGGMALALLSVASVAAAQNGPNCKAVHADLVEDFSTQGCEPPSTACFLGEVDGNHGLRGTTRFDSDSGAAGPSTSPGFISYSGKFEYFTERGTLIMRETGLAHPANGSQDDGVTAAFQRIVDATGEFAGATGYFFVTGFNIGGHVVTKVTGTLCLP
jgi:hypothetical protein